MSPNLENERAKEARVALLNRIEDLILECTQSARADAVTDAIFLRRLASLFQDGGDAPVEQLQRLRELLDDAALNRQESIAAYMAYTILGKACGAVRSILTKESPPFTVVAHVYLFWRAINNALDETSGEIPSMSFRDSEMPNSYHEAIREVENLTRTPQWNTLHPIAKVKLATLLARGEFREATQYATQLAGSEMANQKVPVAPNGEESKAQNTGEHLSRTE